MCLECLYILGHFQTFQPQILRLISRILQKKVVSLVKNLFRIGMKPHELRLCSSEIPNRTLTGP